MKVFISQPMKGKTKEETRPTAPLLVGFWNWLVMRSGVATKTITPRRSMRPCGAWAHPLKFSPAVTLCTTIGERDKNTELPRGCEAEIHCAGSYGIPVFYGEEGLRRLCFQGLKEKA